MVKRFDIKGVLKSSLFLAALGSATLAADTDDLAVAFVQDRQNKASQLGLTSVYQTLATELERTLLLQNIYVLNVQTSALLSAAPKAALFQDQEFAAQDYGVLYSISPDISENSIARLLSLSASGDVYEINSGRLVTSFRVEAPETVPLSKDGLACNKACVESEIAALSDGLARELSFVLTQKLHFLREDQGRVDTTNSSAIAKRLTGHDDQTQLLETITSAAGRYTADKARAVDVNVYFDFDSATLSESAKTQLNPLGEALASTASRQSRYIVAGHTDAKGSADYNRQLSERRAQAVRQYLLQEFAIEPDRLVAIGLGEDHLHTPLEPHAAVNRRVEVAVIVAGPNASNPVADAYDYTLTFDLLPRDAVMKIVRQLEASTVDEIELQKSSTTQRVYSVRTNLALMNFEEQVMLALIDQGMELEQLRISTEASLITVEKIR